MTPTQLAKLEVYKEMLGEMTSKQASDFAYAFVNYANLLEIKESEKDGNEAME